MPSQHQKDNSGYQLKGGHFVRLFDSLFVLRPTLIFPYWTMILAGSTLAVDRSSAGLFRWLLIVIGCSSIFGLVYLLNQIRDKTTDRINRKLFLVFDGIISRRHQFVEIFVLMAIAIVSMAWLAEWRPGLWIGIGTLLLIGFFYSYTRFAFKQHPWGGLLAHVVSGWILVRMGVIIYNGEVSIWQEVPYVIAYSASFLLTNLPDIEGDRQADKRTFSVVYGELATLVVSILMIATSLTLGLIFRDPVITIASGLSLPVLIVALVRKNMQQTVSANKIAIFSLSMAVGFYFPVYILTMILYYPLARWYYKQRFGISYPNFKSK